MRQFPLRYAHGNLLFGPRGERAALYRVETVSYPFLPRRDKELWLARLARFAFSCEADFSLWRVGRAASARTLIDAAQSLVDERHAPAEPWRAYVAGHSAALASAAHTPEVYMAISLGPSRPASLAAAVLAGATRTRDRAERAFGIASAAPITVGELTALAQAEERTLARLTDALPARRATPEELQWLLRRAACRGIGEPPLDPHWQPNALLHPNGNRDGAYEPLELDLARLGSATLLEEERTLIAEAEEGRSHQALLALGALPEEAEFPGGRAELLSAPLEALEFPVDAVVHARWLGNRAALARVRRRIIDADNVYIDESDGRHGATWAAEANRVLARELHEYLDSESHPPLLHASVSFAVGAPTGEELEKRMEQLRSAYGTVSLHRPFGLQPALYLDHLPAPGHGRVHDYTDYLTIEQFGALMPIATQTAGSATGVYIGSTTGRQRRPVVFDTAAASREGRPPSILLVGTLGSGKTIAAQLLALQAALRGALVVDVDPKPDHNLEEVPELEGRVDVLELSGERRYRGLLDPLRIAPPSLRDDLAASTFMQILPQAPPAWETQVRKAVREAVANGARSSTDVISRLHGSQHPDARAAGEALAVWAESGLGSLAFAGSGDAQPELSRPVTTIKAGALTLPDPHAPRSDYSQSERIAVAILTLVAAYALRLVQADRDRPKLVLFDEAWFLLGSADGRRLIDRLNRLGRSQNAAVVLATQQLGDVGEIENLIGTRFIFGQETVAEAERALAMLGLDPRDRELVGRVRSYRRGRCLMRDLDDRIAEIEFDLVYPHLLAALDTSPQARPHGAEAA